jgi:hypothetical protein
MPLKGVGNVFANYDVECHRCMAQSTQFVSVHPSVVADDALLMTVSNPRVLFSYPRITVEMTAPFLGPEAIV